MCPKNCLLVWLILQKLKKFEKAHKNTLTNSPFKQSLFIESEKARNSVERGIFMRKIFAVSILVIAMMFSGCYPTGKKVEENSTVSSTASGSTHLDGTHFEYSKDNLTADFDLPEIPDELPSRIKLKEKMFDHQEVIDLFFGGEAPVSEYLYGANKECGQYTASDGSELIIARNSISYSNGKHLSIMNFDVLNAPVDYFDVVNLCTEFRRDMYSITEDELEGFPLQGALDSANELISKLGIAGLGEPRIYSVSLASYKKMKSEYYLFNDKYPLTKDNEIYVFEFPRLLGEVEALNLSNVRIKDTASERGAGVNSPSVTVGVAKDGIFKFEAEGIYEADHEILSTEPVKYDLGYAVSELEKYLDKVYFPRSKSVVISNAKVVFYPVERNEPGTVEFIPSWSFEGYYRDLNSEAKIEIYENRRDYRLFVNSDVGVVKEYSEG